MSRVVGQVYAVDGVSFEIRRGETLCLVGESGCGKSTVAKTVMRLMEPTAGRIELNGTDISSLPESEVRPYRRAMQIVLQDPSSSLNPRLSDGSYVAVSTNHSALTYGTALPIHLTDVFHQFVS